MSWMSKIKGAAQQDKTQDPNALSIDICGPLPEHMIDKFSRFCLLVPVQIIRTITVLTKDERK